MKLLEKKLKKIKRLALVFFWRNFFLEITKKKTRKEHPFIEGRLSV
jgi:hypothetical protein